ncbi:SusC/RagA family TonB-linked outer membrane protein [Haliscomenobacter hydrossis]|uniref:TonB-dependent receptor plug n=1 Tax=Haliscomenobacter hydrossis (strain ATCC 27775 / DSM 1100 / LMG 10767 / O) TaxID=760192 RepID=F4L3Y4_HALH1|nr:TonB-dependent receptor [Haliscomenobacter hydrossis]AEE49701.1 TonB-dependent receptor plug [Haliscomenobacter hydrossis DSM 1100]
MKKQLLAWLSFVLFAWALNAQSNPAIINSTLHGEVLDEKTKEPVIGATVQIKGTTHGVVTDVEGKFYFQTGQVLPYTLIISNLSYKTREVIAETSNIRITIAEDAKQLNEFVVVGYGTQKKSDLTGSVASVSKQIIEQTPVSSFDRLLQGSVSGVQVVQASGQPGAAVSIRIRGGNSITGGNEPLYVIDGFPVYNDNNDVNAGVTSGPSINALASLNPSDIESIDVLKDASATAIYGSRGANGVVIITTKRGKKGQNNVSYETYYGQQELIKRIDVLTSSRDWALLKNDALIAAGKPAFYTQAQIDALQGGTDWQAAAFKKAPIQNHQLTFSGGDDKTRYAISANYFKQDGILRGSDFDRYSLRLNLDRSISEKFKVGTNLTASRTSANEANSSVVSTLLLLPPTVSIYDANGNYTLQSPFEVALGNPIATLEQEINKTTTFRLLGSFSAEYTILENLVAKVLVGGDIINNKQNRYIPSSLFEGYTTSGSASVGSKFVNTWLNENTLSYTKAIKEHSLNVLAGYTQQSYQNESVIANARGFVSDLLTYNNISSGSLNVLPASSASAWTLQSFLGRINYNFDRKYYLTLTARADGSSRFGKNNKWGYFPSAALAWNLSNESFLEKWEVVNNLKLRLSAGITGNQEIGQFQSLATLSNNAYIFGDQLAVGFAPSRIANPNLSWEKTTQIDFGFDLGLFNDRISLTFDAYRKETSALLLTVPVPYTTGYTTSLQNYGTVENKGFELALNTQNTRGKFQWTSNILFSINRNKILSLGDGVSYLISDPNIAQVGQPLGAFFGFQSAGLLQTGDDVDKIPVIDPASTKPGDRLYTDINGDGKITQADDRTIIGYAQPKFLAGFTNNFAYQGFDLSVFFYASYGNQIFNQNRQQLELLSGQQNAASSALDRWTPTNPANTVQRAKEDPAPVTTSRYVEDASYLRLRTLTFGYTFPKGKLKAIKNLRLYVLANNPLTITKYTGYDPDVSRNEQSTLQQGIDYGSYPIAKSYQFGLNIGF